MFWRRDLTFLSLFLPFFPPQKTCWSLKEIKQKDIQCVKKSHTVPQKKCTRPSFAAYCKRVVPQFFFTTAAYVVLASKSPSLKSHDQFILTFSGTALARLGHQLNSIRFFTIPPSKRRFYITSKTFLYLEFSSFFQTLNKHINNLAGGRERSFIV